MGPITSPHEELAVPGCYLENVWVDSGRDALHVGERKLQRQLLFSETCDVPREHYVDGLLLFVRSDRQLKVAVFDAISPELCQSQIKVVLGDLEVVGELDYNCAVAFNRLDSYGGLHKPATVLLTVQESLVQINSREVVDGALLGVRYDRHCDIVGRVAQDVAQNLKAYLVGSIFGTKIALDELCLVLGDQSQVSSIELE